MQLQERVDTLIYCILVPRAKTYASEAEAAAFFGEMADQHSRRDQQLRISKDRYERLTEAIEQATTQDAILRAAAILTEPSTASESPSIVETNFRAAKEAAHRALLAIIQKAGQAAGSGSSSQAAAAGSDSSRLVATRPIPAPSDAAPVSAAAASSAARQNREAAGSSSGPSRQAVSGASSSQYVSTSSSSSRSAPAVVASASARQGAASGSSSSSSPAVDFHIAPSDAAYRAVVPILEAVGIHPERNETGKAIVVVRKSGGRQWPEQDWPSQGQEGGIIIYIDRAFNSDVTGISIDPNTRDYMKGHNVKIFEFKLVNKEIVQDATSAGEWNRAQQEALRKALIES